MGAAAAKQPKVKVAVATQPTEKAAAEQRNEEAAAAARLQKAEARAAAKQQKAEAEAAARQQKAEAKAAARQQKAEAKAAKQREAEASEEARSAAHPPRLDTLEEERALDNEVPGVPDKGTNSPLRLAHCWLGTDRACAWTLQKASRVTTQRMVQLLPPTQVHSNSLLTK